MSTLEDLIEQQENPTPPEQPGGHSVGRIFSDIASTPGFHGIYTPFRCSSHACTYTIHRAISRRNPELNDLTCPECHSDLEEIHD